MAWIVAVGTLSLLLLFAAVALAKDYSLLAKSLWRIINISREGSFGEAYTQALAFWAASAFLTGFLATGARVLLALALLCGFIWFDDSASYHERFGQVLHDRIGFAAMLGVRGKDFGELLAWLTAAGALAPLFAWAWAGRGPGDGGIAVAVGIPFALLLLFGIAADMVHVAAPPHLKAFVGFIEDGGEMVALAAMAVLATGLLRVGPELRAAAERRRARAAERADPLAGSAARERSSESPQSHQGPETCTQHPMNDPGRP